MEALKSLITNIPDWTTRLDELNGQIEKRQRELASLSGNAAAASTDAGSTARPPSKRSLKNRGSTESLKPAGEPAAHPDPPAAEKPSVAIPAPRTPPNASPARPLPSSGAPAETERPLGGRHAGADGKAGDAVEGVRRGDDVVPSSPISHTASSIQRQTTQVIAAAQAKVRATMRKRQRTESMISAEGATPMYRSRTMIIVYYDSYVQSFFEELVKFVSASRNLMRKAKMAAKVAQIKRMAEMDMPEDEDDNEEEPGPFKVPKTSERDGKLSATAATSARVEPSAMASEKIEVAPSDPNKEDDNGAADLPTIRYLSTRHMRGPADGMGSRMNPRMMLSASGRPLYSRAAHAAFGVSGNQLPDIYDELDKGLDFVQGMCEHAAHQFLRDGDCSVEIDKIKHRMEETRALAEKEMARVEKEEPELLNAPDEPTRSRSFRPQTMRRGQSSSSAAIAGKGATVASSSGPIRPKAQKDAIPDNAMGVIEVDEGIEVMEDDATPAV